MSKYYIYYEDGAYDNIFKLDELKEKHEMLYDLVMDLTFDRKMSVAKYDVLTSKYQYDTLFEIDTDLNIEQIKKVIEHDFVYNEIDLCRVLGEVNNILG